MKFVVVNDSDTNAVMKRVNELVDVGYSVINITYDKLNHLAVALHAPEVAVVPQPVEAPKKVKKTK